MLSEHPRCILHILRLTFNKNQTFVYAFVVTELACNIYIYIVTSINILYTHISKVIPILRV